ncbi:GNAT family N-acetyltransferase [Bizionia arctica]|uniref:N-acetyltransferase n=1 Tax=Bizionia arctica TaxID=1495645 RepID=A0A917GGD4_9FLAO|nr:GNAT family N-acetyltransferase [Bizionia arctica]GGG44220.1 N-acetyltransferase [Bizionia arctica]
MKKQTPNIQIRIANKQDAEFIALLGRVTFTETFGHLFNDKQVLFDYYNETFSVDKIENSIEKPNNIYWIAFADRLAVGYAKLKLNSQSEFITDNNICQLQKIYILQDFLSLKIGFKLQNALLKKAKEKSFNKIWLSVFISNDRAINFYSKNGFKEIGNHDFQIGKDNFEFIAMAKQLE